MKLKKMIAMLLVPVVCLLNVPVTTLAADAPKVKTKITHKPVKEAISGQRITLEAKVKDPQGVDVVRAYFKSAQADDYHFVVMENTAKNKYSGLLPAPSKGAESIEYLILVKNGADQVVKTQSYRTPVKDANENTEATIHADKVQVYTELAEAPQKVVGFTDSIAVDVVESAVKFGYVAGIYYGVEAAGASAATGAVTAGTVAAGTTAIGIGTVAVGAAVVAGGAAAASSGGSSDSGGSTTPADPTPVDPTTNTINIVGTWNYRATFSNCPLTETGTMTFSYRNGSYSATLSSSNGISYRCTYTGATTCSDSGWYDSNPITEAGFNSGFSEWECTDISSAATSFITNNSIRVTGYGNSSLGNYIVEITR